MANLLSTSKSAINFSSYSNLKGYIDHLLNLVKLLRYTYLNLTMGLQKMYF